MSINQKLHRKELLTPLDLQFSLLEALTEALKDVATTDEEGATRHGFRGFLQQLPLYADDDEDPDRFFPYFIVRLENGNTVNDDEPWTVTVSILVGVHDDGTDNQGHKSLLVALNRIVNRFSREATLGAPGYKAFRCLPEMHWELQEDDTYPYFFGGVLLKFTVPKAMREDDNA